MLSFSSIKTPRSFSAEEDDALNFVCMSAETAHVCSTSCVDVASKRNSDLCSDHWQGGSRGALFLPLWKRLQSLIAKPAQGLPISLLFPLKRVSVVLEEHLFHAAVLQQLLQIENKCGFITKCILYIGENCKPGNIIMSIGLLGKQSTVFMFHFMHLLAVMCGLFPCCCTFNTQVGFFVCKL